MSQFDIRALRREDLDRVPGKCWEGRDSQNRLLDYQGILGFAAWEGDRCVGQLHCYRVVPPAWDSDLFPSYGRRDPRSWPLGWPLQVLAERGYSAGPVWGHGCFHIGLATGMHDSDPTYSRRGIATSLCAASVAWASENGYASVVGLGGTELVPDYNIWMGCAPWKVYERQGGTGIASESAGQSMPWWLHTCPPRAQQQASEAIQAGATPEKICARAMVISIGPKGACIGPKGA